MDWFFQPLSEQLISGLDVFIDEWFFVIAFGFLIFELIRYIFMKRISWKLIGDVVTNYVTLAMFIFVNIIVLASFYIAAYVWTSQFAVFDIPVNVVTVLICLILADFAYYWEHRFMHRVNAAWATHSVHHSSPFFNISVAYRFGPMDGVWQPDYCIFCRNVSTGLSNTPTHRGYQKTSQTYRKCDEYALPP